MGDENQDPDEDIPAAGVEDYIESGDPTDYRMWLEWETPFADADKTGNDDSQLCWAAAVANTLAWTGWVDDENSAFEIFRNHFENKPGYTYDALKFYFEEYVPDVSAEMVTVREIRPTRLLDFIKSALYGGEGVIVKIAYPEGNVGHFVTVYGYQGSDSKKNPVLYYTDSDDYRLQMNEMPLRWNNANVQWEILGIYADWHLEYVVSLARP